ncbi:Rieske domain-containing protein [Engraulis encrasicolus]|uniref:Rieske domain-containing protein n=1 Tax=Engraulis encrasicolus TaxID=184585 RepID=UPI002FD0F9A6
MSAGDSTSAQRHFVGKREDLVKAKRLAMTVEGREILIIHHLDSFYALDLHCYHAGSPLEHGDIEEIDKKLCIICPKHKYKITLAKGEGLYRAANPNVKPRVYKWYSKGLKQRTHQVTEEDGDVFVTLSCMSLFLESDYFYTEQGKKDREELANSSTTDSKDQDFVEEEDEG